MALMVEDAYKTSMELGKFDDMTEEGVVRLPASWAWAP